MTREEFHSLALALEDALFAADLKPTELLVARLIVKLSLRSERTITPQLRQKDFADFAGIRESHIAETLGWLMGKRLIELEAPNVYRPNPTIGAWLVKQRVTAAARAREAELLRATAGEFFPQAEIRAGDPRVAFPDAEMEVAAEALKVPKFGSREFRNPEVGGPKSSEIRKSDGASCTARARHVMYGSATQNIRHACHVPGGFQKGEEELTPAKLDLLDQIEELTAGEGKTADFRRTWQSRVREDEIAAFKAIAQTRVTAREGRIKRTIGGCLNWNWNFFRNAGREVGRKLHLL